MLIKAEYVPCFHHFFHHLISHTHNKICTGKKNGNAVQCYPLYWVTAVEQTFIYSVAAFPKLDSLHHLTLFYCLNLFLKHEHDSMI